MSYICNCFTEIHIFWLCLGLLCKYKIAYKKSEKNRFSPNAQMEDMKILFYPRLNGNFVS